jgi:hypothetical protein
MNESDLRNAIDAKVNAAKTPDYTAWTIGVTDNPERRKAEHDAEGKNTKYWKDWKADSETIARNVEQYFLDKKKMKGGTGGGDNPTFVYIF